MNNNTFLNIYKKYRLAIQGLVGSALLLALTTFTFLTLGPPLTPAAQTDPPSFDLAWISEFGNTSSIAWGDYDNDGDLDLAVGHSSHLRGLTGDRKPHNYIYRNDNGYFTPVWTSPHEAITMDIIWGDFDNDNDLDLAVGNGCDTINPTTRPVTDTTITCDPNQIYRNDGIDDNNTPTFSLVWTSPLTSQFTYQLAWGDYDNDGNIDLAVANAGIEVKTYTFTIPYPTPHPYIITASIPISYPNEIYRNEGIDNNGNPLFNSVWESPITESDVSSSIAWGDYNNDGYLDLAVGNTNFTISFNSPIPNYSIGSANQIYYNTGHINGNDPTFILAWSSTETDPTSQLAWGDYDNDGDLDLAVTNGLMTIDVSDNVFISIPAGYINRLYRNNGLTGTNGITPNLTLAWTPTQINNSSALAWGDYDNDGDFDLLISNADFDSQEYSYLYQNNDGFLTTKPVFTFSLLYNTLDISWGDYNNDGLLDFIEGNGDFATGETDRLFINNNETIFLMAEIPSEITQTTSIAWGDYDGDGDLDFAVANKSNPTQLYQNNQGVFTQTWLSTKTNAVDLAWGDYDSDGDIDLIAGNYVNPHIYNNQANTLVMESKIQDFLETSAIAWVDYDEDSDLDLVASSTRYGDDSYQHVQLYNNDNGVFSQTWSIHIRSIISLAWGDYDNDGDLDLMLGNAYSRDTLYQNNNGLLSSTPVWTSPTSDPSNSLAWGDIDNDGDLDVAVGNVSRRNRLYRNEGGIFSVEWLSPEENADDTRSLAWGDYDNDGDLDLIAGNGDFSNLNNAPLKRSNRIYRNDNGILTTVWLGPPDATTSIAWGDYDNDGDLDLLVGNYGEANRIYENKRRRIYPTLNNPPVLTVSRPDGVPNAALFSTARIITQAIIPIPYTLFDAESDAVPQVFAQYSPNGGGVWLPATMATPTLTIPLTTSPWPTGTAHTFWWHAEKDLIKNDMLAFRLCAQPGYKHSPILWPAQCSQSSLFRIQPVPWFTQVIDENGQVKTEAHVYYNGQLLTKADGSPDLTDQAGLVRLPNAPLANAPLVALAPAYTHPTKRLAHDNWAYKVYLTNLNLDNNGNPHPEVVGTPGKQLLQVRKNSPLILFNIVVSIEWDADEAYIQTISNAFRLASDYLYDVSDGQMAFGQVSIYDRGDYWSEADFQISTKNTVRPYARIKGIAEDDTAHAIRVGRFWDGNSGNQGAWDESDGYRTLIHEFGHYALYLYDEYFIIKMDAAGNFIGISSAACTDPLIKEKGYNESATDGSLMDYQYKTSELVDNNRWNENCQNTEQNRLNQGQSDWETILNYYDNSLAWHLSSPDSGRGVMAGPENFPTHLLPMPQVISNTGGKITAIPRTLTVLTDENKKALVTLNTTPYTYPIAIDQGITDNNGRITILGAVPGDTVQVVTFDGVWATAIAITNTTTYTIDFRTSAKQKIHSAQNNPLPYIWMIPATTGDTLRLQVRGLPISNNNVLNAIIRPMHIGNIPQSATLTPIQGVYEDTIALSSLGSGQIQVIGSSLTSILNSDYHLQQTIAISSQQLRSEDGNLTLYLPPHSFTTDGYATVVSMGHAPTPLPMGKEIIGKAYGINVSGSVVTLNKTALLELDYDSTIMGVYTNTSIHRWSELDQEWHLVSNKIDNTQAVTVTQLGIYALMRDKAIVNIYLPLILK